MSADAPRAPLPAGALGILYFDGYCGLCDRLVTWLASRDRSRRLRFASLQGTTATARLPADARALHTVVFEDAEGRHERSTAVLRAIATLGGGWPLAAAPAHILPRPVRDALYDLVARHRHQWFGRRATCRLPAAEEGDRFLP